MAQEVDVAVMFLPPISPQRGVLMPTLRGRRACGALAEASRKPSSISTPTLPSLAANFVSGGSKGSTLAFMPDNEEHNFGAPTKLLHRGQDTVQMWRNYRKQATAHQGSLSRGPRWRCESRIMELASTTDEADGSSFSNEAVSWAADAQCAHVQRRRDLRKKLREAKDFVAMSEKRGFVTGLVASEEVSDQCASEKLKLANSRVRIECAIRDCSRSRQELVTMQKEMAAVVKDDNFEAKRRNAFSKMRSSPITMG